MFLGSGRRLVGRIEDIVHEVSRLELIARMALDKLIANGSVTAKSPFRSRPRPLTRVLHAGFTAQRVLYALEPCVDLMTGRQRDEVVWHITHSRRSALTAIRSLEQSAQWTDVGDRFFASMRQGLAAPATA